MARQPIRDGWRILRRAPEAVVAEIAWRWTFGVTMWVLLFVSLHTYFSQIEISRAEYETLKALEPFTWIAIAVRVLRAFVSGMRIVGPVLVPALSLLWIVLSSAGRVFTVRGLSVDKDEPNWTASFAVQALRVLVTAAAVLAYFGAGFLIGGTIDPRVHFAASVLLISVAMLFVASVWAALNWFLSFAAIFPAKDGADLMRSFQRTADLLLRGNGPISLWFALMRTCAVVATSLASCFLFAAMLAGHWRGPLIATLLVTMLYFATADFLYIWRLAAYIGVTEPERQVQESAPGSPLLAPEHALVGNPQPNSHACAPEAPSKN
jgi:hypothetical protein